MKDKVSNLYQNQLYRKYLLGLLLIILFCLSYVIYCWSNTQSTDNAYLKADLANVSIEISGVIKQVLEVSNKKVSQNQTIALIDDHDFKANLAKAEAALTEATKNIEVIEQRLIIEQINKQKLDEGLELAKTTFELTNADFKRITKLTKENFVSKKISDDTSIALEKSKAEYNQKMLDLKTSQQTLTQLDFEKEAALANKQSLEQSKILAVRSLENTVIKAPIDGWLANNNLQIGNYVRPGNILFSVVPSDMYVEANFKETQIAKFKSGMLAVLKFDSLPSTKIQGKIRNISPATGATFSLIPPDNATGNFTKVVQRVPVRIDFIMPENLNFKLVPGMSAKVDIRTDQ